MKTTTQAPQEKPWLSDAELNSLSAVYMVSVIAMVIGIGIYAIASFAKQVWQENKKRQMLRLIANQVGTAMTRAEMVMQKQQLEKEGIN